MSDPDIAELSARIRKAQCERDAWRAKGNQEKFLEAYFRAEALEFERDRLLTQRRRSIERSQS